MFRKLTIICVLAVFAVGFVPITSVSAAPPEPIDVPDYINIFRDVDEGKSVWINVTAFDLCLFAFGGFVGPPPVVDNAIPASIQATGRDGQASVAHINASELYIEVWNTHPDASDVEACEDIVQQVLSGAEPWATGTTALNARTNKLVMEGLADPELARASSGGFSGTANLTTEDGDSYRYRFNDHVNDRCSESRCAVMNTSLRLR